MTIWDTFKPSSVELILNQHDATLYNSVTLLCFQRESYYSDLFVVEPSTESSIDVVWP